MSSSLVLVCENSSGLNDKLSTGLSPWDLLWVPTNNQKEIRINIKKNPSKTTARYTNFSINIYSIFFLPDAKNSDSLLTKEKGLLILNLELTVLPATVNCIIFEHICLQTPPKNNSLTTIENRKQQQK